MSKFILIALIFLIVPIVNANIVNPYNPNSDNIFYYYEKSIDATIYPNETKNIPIIIVPLSSWWLPPLNVKLINNSDKINCYFDNPDIVEKEYNFTWYNNLSYKLRNNGEINIHTFNRTKINATDEDLGIIYDNITIYSLNNAELGKEYSCLLESFYNISCNNPNPDGSFPTACGYDIEPSYSGSGSSGGGSGSSYSSSYKIIINQNNNLIPLENLTDEQKYGRKANIRSGLEDKNNKDNVNTKIIAGFEPIKKLTWWNKLLEWLRAIL